MFSTLSGLKASFVEATKMTFPDAGILRNSACLHHRDGLAFRQYGC